MFKLFFRHFLFSHVELWINLNFKCVSHIFLHISYFLIQISTLQLFNWFCTCSSTIYSIIYALSICIQSCKHQLHDEMKKKHYKCSKGKKKKLERKYSKCVIHTDGVILNELSFISFWTSQIRFCIMDMRALYRISCDIRFVLYFFLC